MRTAAPSRFDSTVSTGFCTVTVAASARSASTAGAMCAVWKAPATCSGRSRAPAGGSAANAASCSAVPAATIWPAPLMLAGVSPCASMAVQDGGLVAAEHGRHRGLLGRRGGRHRAAADADQPHRVLRREITPAIAPAASSPTLWPATMPEWCPSRWPGCCGPSAWPLRPFACSPVSDGPMPSTPAAASAAATSSGCATAVSLISSAVPTSYRP